MSKEKFSILRWTAASAHHHPFIPQQGELGGTLGSGFGEPCLELIAKAAVREPFLLRAQNESGPRVHQEDFKGPLAAKQKRTYTSACIVSLLKQIAPPSAD